MFASFSHAVSVSNDSMPIITIARIIKIDFFFIITSEKFWA